MTRATEAIPPPEPIPEGGSRWVRFVALYRRTFGVAEIEASRPLQWLFWATLYGFFITYYDWYDERTLTRQAAAEGKHRCWPFFQSCGDYYFLETPPDGYSQPVFYMALFALLGGAALAARSRRWTLAHALLVPLFAWKVIVDMALSMLFLGNYHYFHISFTFLLLFARYKMFFLRRALVLLYFLAAAIKIHEGWILGTYFTSLQTGMPLFPDALVPVFTNLLIFVETVGCALLLSKNKILQRGALVTMVFFHLYSGILVRYLYPTMCMPALLIFYGPEYDTIEPPLVRRAALGWAFFAWVLAMQSISYLIKGDVKLTLEGNYYGLYMFEANHQCVSTARVVQKNGKVKDRSTESRSARRRCGSYAEWFRLQQVCKRPSVERVEWSLDHSINGGPFYRIVDEPDACKLKFAPLRHNPWIRLPEEGARIVGYPVKNLYD